MAVFDTITDTITGKPKRLPVRDLIKKESALATRIFGSVPKGSRREFFCLDRHTWIWYEEWTDPNTKQQKSLTTRYEITPRGVIKAQDGMPYAYVQADEFKNFHNAVKQYHKIVMTELYSKA